MVNVFKSIAAFIYYWKKILKNSILVINWQFARLSVISKNQLLQHFNIAVCIIKISRNSDLTYFWKFALYYQNFQFLLYMIVIFDIVLWSFFNYLHSSLTIFCCCCWQPASARGIGIRVIHKWNQIPRKRPVIVQRYLN